MAKKASGEAVGPRPMGFAQMLRDVLVASMNKGQFPLAIVGLIVIFILYKMPSEDVSRLVFQTVEDLENGRLFGYFMWLITTAAWFIHARRQRRIITDEMARIGQERTKLQAEALGHRVKSSEGQR